MFQFVVALMVTALPWDAAVTPASADNASTLLGLVNGLRANHGLSPLYADPALTAVSQAWANHMAGGNTATHNPNLASQAGGGWTKLGENVAAAGNIDAVFNAFVNSSFHLGNMLDPTYNLTGIGVGVSGPTLFVSEDFEAKPGATPVVTRPPATSATTSRPQAPQVPTGSSSGGAGRTTAPPTPPPTVTSPPTTASGVRPPDSATVTAGSTGTGVAPRYNAAPPAPSPVPGQLAAGPSLSAHRDTGGLSGWVAMMAVLALATTAGAAVVIAKWARSGVGSG